MSNTNPTKKVGVNTGGPEWYAVPASYNININVNLQYYD